jgi:hypothetical protein
MKRMTAVALLVLLTTPTLASAGGRAGPFGPALAGDKAAYVAGTMARFNMARTHIEGRVEIGPRQFVFVPDIGLHAGAKPLVIDYESIHHLEFGQHVSRRVALVSGATAVLGPLGLVSLLAKSRAHYLTMTYASEQSRAEVIVIELGKDVVRSTLAIVEARSGIPIEYQDEVARKWRR